MTCTLIVHYRFPQPLDAHFTVYLLKYVTCNYIQRSKNVILHVYYRFPSANDTNTERFCCMALKVILTLLQILKYSQETFLFGKSISGKPRIPEKWTEFCLHYSTERGIFNKPYILVTTSLL